MDITGYDSVLFAADFGREAAHEFLLRLATIWPEMLVTIETDQAALQTLTGLPVLGQVPADNARITCCRDSAMDEHWTEHGYDPMPDGEGPIYLIYKTRHLEISIRVDHDHGWSGDLRQPATYPARLVASAAIEITLVSPDDPLTHPFSERVYAMLIEALGLPATSGVRASGTG